MCDRRGRTRVKVGDRGSGGEVEKSPTRQCGIPHPPSELLEE